MAKRRLVLGAIDDGDGLYALAKQLRDTGREVVLVGGNQSAEQLIGTAIAEDAYELVVVTDDESLVRFEAVRKQHGAEHLRLTPVGFDGVMHPTP